VNLRLSRVRGAEWVAAAASLLLVLDVFALAWFRVRRAAPMLATAFARHPTLDGWQTSLPAGVLSLIVACVCLAILLLTATRRSPALPVVMNTLVMPLSLALFALIAVRVLLLAPSVQVAAHATVAASRSPGAWSGLALSAVILAGLYAALRREGVAAEEFTGAIETLMPPPLGEQPRTQPRA